MFKVADSRGFRKASALRLDKVGMLFRVPMVARFLAESPFSPGDAVPLTRFKRAERGAGDAAGVVPEVLVGIEASRVVSFIDVVDWARFCALLVSLFCHPFNCSTAT